MPKKLTILKTHARQLQQFQRLLWYPLLKKKVGPSPKLELTAIDEARLALTSTKGI